MARRRVVTSDTDELAEIEAWYRDRLTRPAERPQRKWQPVAIGPTWQLDGDHWLLPERTLGWQRLAWCGRWLQLRRGEPWRFTDEQARFILHWDALDENWHFVYRDGVLQRLKGWGKDPLGACLCMSEMLGPARVVDVVDGQPVGGDVVDAWVQTAAVSLEQTKNTMRLLPGLISAEARAHFGIQPGKETVYALGDQRFMQAVTSSPATLEGARATAVLLNETQHWTASNAGHEMSAVIERNATKSPDGAARTLRITNAYEPGEDSVAERDREAYEGAEARTEGVGGAVGLLYDSLEAPPDASLSAVEAPAVVEAIRGDSVWLNTDRIVESISDIRNPAARSRRFWYNQITAAEDAWADPQKWDPCAAPHQLVLPDEPIVAFFDGSKSDDATGLVGCRLTDGFIFTIGVWARPPAERGKGWIVDRTRVDDAVEAMMAAYRVKALFGDPSDVRDDAGERFWEPMLDDWHRRYATKLDFWAVRKGDSRHAISWDMRSPERQREFTAAAERFVTEMEDGPSRLTHDGNRVLRAHVLNARKRTNDWGVTLGKKHRESSRKIDLAVCAVGARMVRRMVLNKVAETKKRSGKVW